MERPMTSMAMVRKVHADHRNDKSMTFVLSDETPDRIGDIIKVDGWQLDEFNKNPIALFGHRSDFIVGTWKDVRVEKGQLLGELQPAPKGISERTDEIIRFVESGILRAVSVGFVPIERKIRRTKEEAFSGFTYTKQTLSEASMVAVGANPNALAVAKQLNLSSDARNLVFAVLGNEDKAASVDHIGVPAKLMEPDRWSPEEARKAKFWLQGFMKDHPGNPFYRKLYRLLDEIECVRTIVAVSGRTKRTT
jgi:HK97 family phage prohead protease